MHKSFALLLTSALALSACAPSLQDAPVGTAVTPPIEWRTQLGASAPVEAAWWESFGDPRLSRLVEQADRHAVLCQQVSTDEPCHTCADDGHGVTRDKSRGSGNGFRHGGSRKR